MSDTETYEILAIKYGAQTQRLRKENFMHDDDHASPGPIDYFIWVLRNQNRTIVVDTGFDHKEAAARGRKIDHEPKEILKRVGVDAECLLSQAIQIVPAHAVRRTGRLRDRTQPARDAPHDCLERIR